MQGRVMTAVCPMCRNRREINVPLLLSLKVGDYADSAPDTLTTLNQGKRPCPVCWPKQSTNAAYEVLAKP